MAINTTAMITLKEAAKVLGISYNAAQRLAIRGKMPGCIVVHMWTGPRGAEYRKYRVDPVKMRKGMK